MAMTKPKAEQILYVPTGPISSITVQGAIDEIVSRSIEAFGASEAATAADNTSAITAAITFMNTCGGGIIEIPPGNYSLNGVVAQVNCNLHIKFHAGAKLVLAAGLSVPALSLYETLDGTGVSKLTLSHPDIDVSLGTLSVGAQSTTAIALDGFAQADVLYPNLYGGTTWNNTNADSGITTGRCRIVNILYGKIRGFADVGIYVSGDSIEGPDGYVVNIVGTVFENCNGAITTKRQYDTTRVSGCSFLNCSSGVRSDFIVSPELLQPGRLLDIYGCRFTKMRGTSINIRGNTKGIIRNCEIEDWGYESDGIDVVGLEISAITIEGCTEIKLTDVDIAMHQWTRTTQRGIIFDDYTTSTGVSFAGGHNIVNGLTCTNLFSIIRDLSTYPNTYTGVYMDNCGTLNSTDLNANTIVEYIIKGDNLPKVKIGNKVYLHKLEQFSLYNNNVTFDAIGSLDAGSTSDVQEITTTDSRSGDIVVLSGYSAGSMSPSLNIGIRVTEDKVQVQFKNIGVTTFNFVGQRWSLSISRP